MNRYTRTLSRLFLVGSVVAIAFLSGGIAQAAGPVPFRGTIEIRETVQPNLTLPLPCPLFSPPTSFGLRGDITGKGAATHLGKITATSVDCIIPVSEDGSRFVAFSTQFAMTSANGDQIFAFYTAELTVSTATGVGALRGEFVILGGTGTFANASGGGTLQGVEVIQFSGPFTGTGQGRIELSGTISY